MQILQHIKLKPGLEVFYANMLMPGNGPGFSTGRWAHTGLNVL